jgi:hypothetical protein
MLRFNDNDIWTKEGLNRPHATSLPELSVLPYVAGMAEGLKVE